MSPLDQLIGSFSTINQILLYSLLAIISLVLINIFNQLIVPKSATTPPVVFHLFPFIGSAVSYGIDPYAFLESCRKKYGNVFTFILLNKKVTVALGLEGNALVFNGKLSQVNAEEAYTALTTPVFGTDVVFDVPNPILMQQKKFIKSGLTPENFRKYVSMIADETIVYLEDHVFQNPKTQQTVKDAFKVASEITICTAAATLQGPEVREGLNKSFADLYHDLDGGFTPIHFAFPNLPLPSYRRRDQAQVAMRNFYLNIIRKRREDNREGQLGDIIDSLQGQTYKDGRPLTDKEIAHMMIALLMAGQHTSAATGSWLLLHLASRPDLVAELRQEQIDMFGKPGQTDDNELDPLDLERVQSPLMIACIKEVLRLHPPIHSIMRKVKSPITVPRTLASHDEDTPYIIPSSHFVLAAPGASQIDPSIWSAPHEFQPKRWLSPIQGQGQAQEEMVDYGFGMISSGANSPFLPFGAGRHRCIGEQFAYLQLSTFGATVIRNCDLELTDLAFPKPDYTTMLVCPMQPRNIKFTRRNHL
uniref:Putative sterol 14-demethylase n=1 Tax=Puccinia horiana TaxID=331382 RepID=W8FTE2_9BASI|nr:putative sterol 14-demethylase [Puccinia horiana]